MKITNIKLDLSAYKEFQNNIQKEPFITFKNFNQYNNNNNSNAKNFNKLYTCLIRIEETTDYINSKALKGKNICGQAFDFYELINSISIIVECIIKIFEIFSIKIDYEKKFPKGAVFKISNADSDIKLTDYSFFKFIRSASSVHPAKTNRFIGKTKSNDEFFPFVVWIDKKVVYKRYSIHCDLALKMRDANNELYGGNYFLQSSEFYNFAQCCIDLMGDIDLIQKVNSMRNNYIKQIRLDNTLNENTFNNYFEYIHFLYDHLQNIHEDDFDDAGLLVASDIYQNEIISREFKNYLKIKIKKIVALMKDNPERINSANIFKDLKIDECFLEINPNQTKYIFEKFRTYLIRDLRFAILNDNKEKIKKDDNVNNDSHYVYKILSTKLNSLYTNNELRLAVTYADVIYLTLQAVYFYRKRKGMKI